MHRLFRGLSQVRSSTIFQRRAGTVLTCHRHCHADVLRKRHLSGIEESPAGRRGSLGTLSAAGYSGGGGIAGDDRGEGRVKGAGAARAELAGGSPGKGSA